MPTRLSFVARLLAAGAALTLLAGCPGLDHVFDPSSIQSVTIDPDPVPMPTDTVAASFDVRVSFDSERDNDRLVIRMRDPHQHDRYEEIGAPVPCPHRREGGGCGRASITVNCTVQLSQIYAGERSVGCGTSRVEMPPGDYTLRVEIVNEWVDDTYNATVRIR